MSLLSLRYIYAPQGKKDLDVLLRIKEYYGVGTIIIGKTRDICIFRVTKIKTYLK